jgi:hypothetical protein
MIYVGPTINKTQQVGSSGEAFDVSSRGAWLESRAGN